MTINQLEAFIAVAQAGSFTAAAQKMYISPQALIQQVGKLERELGYALFSRGAKGTSLSPAGKVFYDGIETLLGQLKRVKEQAAQVANKGCTLRVGLPDRVNPVFLLSVCKRFALVYPDVRLVYETYSRKETIKALLNGQVDVCAQIKPMEMAGYACERLFSVEQYAVVSRNHPIAQSAFVTPDALRGQTVGIWGGLETYRAFIQEAERQALDIRFVSIREEISEALLFCMDGHVLMTSVPVVSYLRSTLLAVPIRFGFGIDYYVAYRGGKCEAVARFLDIARAQAQPGAHPWSKIMEEYGHEREALNGS